MSSLHNFVMSLHISHFIFFLWIVISPLTLFHCEKNDTHIIKMKQIPIICEFYNNTQNACNANGIELFNFMRCLETIKKDRQQRNLVST